MRKTLYFLFWLSCSLLANSQTSCSPGVQVCEASPSSGQVFSEVLGQVGLGGARTYELAHSPVSSQSVRVFMGSLELQAVIDYILQGDKLTLTGRTMGAPRDVIRVSYTANVTPVTAQIESSTIAVRPLIAVPQVINKESNPERADIAEALSRLLERSLNNELNVASALVKENVKDIRNANIKPSPQNPASLRMLTYAVERDQRIDLSKQKRAKKSTGKRSSMAGLEGLGDGSSRTPFDFLQSSTEGLGPSLDRIDATAVGVQETTGASRTTKAQRRLPRSIVMLQQKIVDDN